LRADVERDLSKSAADFLRVVWPKVQGMLGGGRLIPVETNATTALVHDFDTLAGIDAWHMLDAKGVMRGIASRVQWGKNWRTFTIRVSRPTGGKTEFAKRLFAIDNPDQGWLFPVLTVQAYVAEPAGQGRLLGAGVIKTRELFEFARTHPRPLRYAGNGGEGFMHYRWAELRQAGYRVGEAEGDQLVASLQDWTPGTAIQESLLPLEGEK
jgi:hypothetical protein